MDLCTQSKKTEREEEKQRENERVLRDQFVAKGGNCIKYFNWTLHSKENHADKARTKLKLNKMHLTLGELQ